MTNPADEARQSGLSRSVWSPYSRKQTPSTAGYNTRTNETIRRSRERVDAEFDSRPQSLPPHETRKKSNAQYLTPIGGIGAPSATATAASSSRQPPLPQALRRFEQICLRLRWKKIDLEQAYGRALNHQEWGFDQLEAERNFKVDFHEFYAWIEQAVVLTLIIFDVPMASATWTSGGKHTFHHDVVRTVEDDDGPLGKALGRGEVVQAFWKAKELRNRWKGVHVDGEEAGPPLRMYHLAWIVEEILGGLERVYVLAKEKVREAETEGGDAAGSGEQEEEGWDWMVESMDWESN